MFPVLIAFLAIPLAHARAMPPPVGRDVRGEPVYPTCPTESAWTEKCVSRGLQQTFGF
jgi:hypothetical protein